VLIDGPTEQAALFAGRLARSVPRARVATCGDTTPGADDLTIWLRTGPASGNGHGGGGTASGEPERRREREERADIVVDLHDADWPVIRRVAAQLAAGGGAWYLAETRAFFACRAATWDTKFGDDLPAYAAAVAEAGLPRGGVVIDVGCGTGRVLPALRDAVGSVGAVIALDVTPEMLLAARPASEAAQAGLVLADARALPFADASADGVFAAGLVNHLPDPEAGLRELARVTKAGGVLVLFHPSGRAAIAARHGRALSADEPLSEEPLRRSAQAAGWRLTAYDDAPHRFFALATRCEELPGRGRDHVEEIKRGYRGRAAPGEQRRVEARAAGVPGLKRLSERHQHLALRADQLGGVLARPVEQRELEQQLGADLPDVLDGGVQPAVRELPSLRRRGVDGALRAKAWFRALRLDQGRLVQAADGPVHDRLRYLPDAAEVTAGGGQLGDREAVRGLLAEQDEHQPLRQRYLRQGCLLRSRRWLATHGISG
jgi:SAM-dependent methyltransferase